MQNGTVYFREEQRFTQPFIWVLILPLSLLAIVGFYQQIIMGRPFGDNPAPDWMICLIFVLIGLGLPYFFTRLRLVTEVKEDGVYIRFFPIERKGLVLLWDDIKNMEAVTYRPILDYGGWGIRYGRKGKAYNVRGNRGVKISTEKGKEILIGSQKAEQLAQAILSAHRGKVETGKRG